MKGKRHIEFTVREWEDVAYEIDLNKIGRVADWSMLERGAQKLGMSAPIFRKWLLIWIAHGKKTAELPIIRSKQNDKQRDNSETERIRELPTLNRRR